MSDHAYRHIVGLELPTIPPVIALEIGADRGDGSTEFLARYFQTRGIPFVTVDFEAGACQRASKIPGITVIQMKGEDYLKSSLGFVEICFAYLDNFDYIWPSIEHQGFVHDQIRLYAEHGIEMNNENSRLAHLAQAKLIECRMPPQGVIIFDDTWWNLRLRKFDGKGGYGVPWLLGLDFRIIHQTPDDGRPENDRFIVLQKI